MNCTGLLSKFILISKQFLIANSCELGVAFCAAEDYTHLKKVIDQ
jgi:hypothetical protein